MRRLSTLLVRATPFIVALAAFAAKVPTTNIAAWW